MTTDAIKNKVIEISKDGRLSCAQALKLANELNVSPMAVGAAANDAKIKIISCQLGCFK
jgi:LAO/AO transport system kinase